MKKTSAGICIGLAVLLVVSGKIGFDHVLAKDLPTAANQTLTTKETAAKETFAGETSTAAQKETGESPEKAEAPADVYSVSAASEASIAETAAASATSAETTPAVSSAYANYTPALTIDYAALKAQNPDYIGWINIPGTVISYPIVQTANNTDYLNKGFDGSASAYGTIFEDGYGVNGLNQWNIILYGHNMKNGSMFGSLKKFKEKSYFDQHRYIEIYAKDKVMLFKIFAVRYVSSDINTLNYQLDSFEYKDYAANARTNAFQFEVPEVMGQLLSLSTCMGDYSMRLMVNAMRVN